MSASRSPEFVAWCLLCKALGVRRYVELGTFRGETAQEAAEIIGTQAVTIDPNPGGGLWTINGSREVNGRVTFLRGLSTEPGIVGRVREEFQGDPPDAVFVDGEHSQEGVTRDYRLWWPEARLLMGFDDADNPEVPGPARFWESEPLPMSRVRLYSPGGAGIEVLFK